MGNRSNGGKIMNNKLQDLNDRLFEQMDRLSDKNLNNEQLEEEIKRTDAIVDVSEQIINNVELSLKATKLVTEHGAFASDMCYSFLSNIDMLYFF